MVWSRNSQGLPPAKLSEKNLIHISKEQNPGVSDGPRPPTLWPQLQGQKGESARSRRGSTPTRPPPAPVCAQGGAHSRLGASAHPSTVAALSAQRGHGGLGQAGSLLGFKIPSPCPAPPLKGQRLQPLHLGRNVRTQTHEKENP